MTILKKPSRMKKNFYEDAKQVWKKPELEAAPLLAPSDVARYKKMLDIFQVGSYYFFIFNLATADFAYMSPEVTQVLGYDQSVSARQIVEAIHPDDRQHFIRFELDFTRFATTIPPESYKKYKLQYDFRIRHRNGTYRRILHQVMAYHHVGTEVLQSICVHTDITHLKKHNIPEFALIGYEGEPSYRFGDFYRLEPKSMATRLSNREHEILTHVLDAKTAREIAEELCISVHTVNTHRKRILSKTGCRSIQELMLKCKSLSV